MDRPTIAIIGGTGDLGSGLAARWAEAGYRVVLGSRSRDKAQSAAAEIGANVRGEDNISAAKAGDIVIIAVPFANHDATLAELRAALEGKIVVDAAVPLVPPKVSVVQLPPLASAAQAAKRILGAGVKVTSAFHNVGARKLRGNDPVECDVLVFGDDKAAKDAVIALAEAAGTRGIDGGPLENSVAAEALTSVLIGINRRYKVDGAGIRITGLSA
jgi:8-hydroxy-5-deazaflavin:NADPH oxidoreductase